MVLVTWLSRILLCAAIFHFVLRARFRYRRRAFYLPFTTYTRPITHTPHCPHPCRSCSLCAHGSNNERLTFRATQNFSPTASMHA